MELQRYWSVWCVLVNDLLEKYGIIEWCVFSMYYFYFYYFSFKSGRIFSFFIIFKINKLILIDFNENWYIAFRCIYLLNNSRGFVMESLP